MGMDSDTLDSLMDEIGLGDENYMDTVLDEAVTDTVWEKAAQTVNSVFFTIIKYLFRRPYQKFLEAVRELIPNLFVIYATGTWLEMWAADFDLERDLGDKARHRVRITKASADLIDLPTGSVFYVDETPSPRRFQTLENYEFGDGVTECLIIVEAVDIGSTYNVIDDMITKCESSIPYESIANYEQIVTGANVEKDDELRARIQNKRFANKIEYGVEAKYISALKSVSDIKHAKLTSVSAGFDATLNFTVYGDGVLSPEKIDECQATLQDYLMETDASVVAGAVPEELTLTIRIEATYDETSVRSIIATWFSNQEKDASFESSLLIEYLYDIYPSWFGKAVRVSPAFDDLSASSFYSPAVTFEAWGS